MQLQKIFGAELIPISEFKAIISQETDIKKINQLGKRIEAVKRLSDASHGRANYFSEIAIWNDIRLGELIIEGQARGEIQDGKLPPNRRLHDATVCLHDLGIEKTQSSRVQKLAKGQEAVAEWIEQEKAKDKAQPGDGLITKAGAIAAAKSVSIAKKANRDKEIKETIPIPSTKWSITKNQRVVKCDAVITDPPYGITDEEWEPSEIGEFTKEWLTRWNDCEANWFASFFSQRFLFDARNWFDESLTNYEFSHLLVWHYPNGMGHKNGQVFKDSWEPIFLYKKKGFQHKPHPSDWSKFNNLDAFVLGAPRDSFSGTEEKVHPCQKPVKVMGWLVAYLSKEADKIVDPFCGSGSTGVAAVQAGRVFHGIEVSARYRDIATFRIQKFGGATE